MDCLYNQTAKKRYLFVGGQDILGAEIASEGFYDGHISMYCDIPP